MPKVSVRINNATGLRSTQTFGKQDPFVKLIYGRRICKTRTDENGHKTPTWNQLLNMSTVPLNSEIIIEVWNENGFSDNIIASASMKISTENYEGSINIPLTYKSKSSGTLNIELVIRPEAGSQLNLANAGTQLFQQAVAAPVAPRAVAYLPHPPAPVGRSVGGGGGGGSGGGGGGSGASRFVSQDKSIVDTSSTNDILVPLGSGNDLRVGLCWDFADVDGDGQGDTDLDLSCVLFDTRGQFMKACYFAEPNPFGNGAVFHTGDNRDGKGDGDDETILLDLDKLVHAGVSSMFFAVNSFNGSSFRAVKSASSRLVAEQNNQELSYVTMSLEDRNATSLISGRLTIVGNQWTLRPMAVTGKNTCFADVVPEMQKRLKDLIPRVKIAPAPTGIIMTKGESLPVPSTNFKVGLGWDQVGNPVDLDASVVCLRSDCSLADACFFGKLKVFNGALKHTGDNRSGAGDGDDESIFVFLDSIPLEVTYLCVVVNCYDNVPLNNVRNAYIRLTDHQGTIETHRYNLNALGARAAYLMATIYRDRNSNAWMLKTNSTEADGNTYKAMLPAIQQACANLYSK